MEDFTARNALLTGVELIRRRPLLVLLWAALSLALTIVLATTYLAYLGWVWGRASSGVPVANLNLLTGALIRTVLSMFLGAVLWASAFRAILRPGEPASLRLGGEELLILGAQVVTQLVMALPVLAWAFATTHDLTGVLAINRWIMTAFEVLGLFWSAVASVWAFGRLQIAPFRCWTIALGRFWLLASLVVGVLVLGLLANAWVNSLAADLGHVFRPAVSPRLYPFITVGPQVQDAFRIPTLLRDVLSAALGALEIAFIAGIVASAYRASAPKPQAATFSSVVSGPAS